MTRKPTFLEALPDVPIAREEIRYLERYFWDNATRPDGRNRLVIQQTLEGSVFFENAQGRRWVGAGEAMVFRHGEPSRYGLDDRCVRPYRNRWIQIREDDTMRVWPDRIREEFGPVLRLSEQGEAGRMIARLVEDQRHAVQWDRLYLAEVVSRLFIALYREQIGARRGNDPVAFGRHLLETQFRSPRNLKEWCEEIGISREHFSREFSNRYGETPAAYLRALRLRHADELLKTHTLPLADIAAASGFASEQTFHRAYRMFYGIPPGRGRG